MIYSVVFLLIFLVASAVSLPGDDERMQLSLSEAIDNFGLNLLHQLELEERQTRGTKHDKAKNILISPFSVATVLSMLLAGANNTTHDQIFQTLGFNSTNFKEDSEIFSSYKTLFHNIRNEFSSDKKNELQVANSIALKKNFTILPNFLDTVKDGFDSKVFLEDFATKSHESTADINKWVADKTNGKIEKLFTDDLDANTAMVLLNGIFFKGSWKTKFEKNHTKSFPFHVDAQKSVTVPYMYIETRIKLQLDDDYLFELPYEGSLSMVIYMPRWKTSNQTISSRFASGSANKLAQRLASLKEYKVNFFLPKFKIESDFSLNSPLNSLGIVDAFKPSFADFSKINGQANDLYLSKVVHKTFLEVNEEGSEAAAATGGELVFRSEPPVFFFDLPFLFLIRDNLHQLTLFAGIVNKP